LFSSASTERGARTIIFESRLLDDGKQCREAAVDSSAHSQQTALSDHFNPCDETIIPYSDKAFELAAIKWLVQTVKSNKSPSVSE
jgi:hypothetical protein